MFRQLKSDCPICLGSRKDCRSGDQGLIHCRSNTTPTGYDSLGQDAQGFNLFKPTTTTAKLDHEVLGIITRNREYRRGISELWPSHRAALRDRGLSDEQVTRLNTLNILRSWEPGTQTDLSPQLAGIDHNGRTLGAKGIAIAAVLDDRITGYQIANDDRSTAKYLWLSSKNKGGNGPHLPNGDLPIACWVHPDESPTEAIFCEGFLKSLIVAEKLWATGQTQYLVLGAAGGNFSASANSVQQVLDQHDITSILLAPDAGAITNPQIMQMYDRARTVVCVGRSFNVLWWDQMTKESKDIDELPTRDLKALQIIDWAEFTSLKPETPESAAIEAKTSNATKLQTIADGCELWKSDDQQAWIDVFIGGHRESMLLSSAGFKSWLAGEFHGKHGRHVGNDAIGQVLMVLAARALSAPIYEIFHRVAKIGDEIYLDIGDRNHTVIKICGAGWGVLEGECPAKFRRPNSMKALPMPSKDADWSGLKNILNLQDKDWVLLMTWLSWGLYPDRPHPILILNGEQGTGKSKTSELLKRLIDPAKALLLSMPEDARALKSHANNRWCLTYDNLSGLSSRMSDLLCRVATKSGFSERALYTDDDESVFDGVRPIILNGIEAMATRPDLLDRSIILNLSPIDDDHRMTEEAWENCLTDCQSHVLGSMLNALAQGLRRKSNVRPIALARMADFHVWGHCVESAFEFEPGAFEIAYQANRNLIHETAIDNDATATAILQLLEVQNFMGSASELLSKLGAIVTDEQRKAPDWIKSPRVLGRRLARLAPELRKHGIEIRTGFRIAGVRTIALELIPKAPEIISSIEEETIVEEYSYEEPTAPLEVGEDVVFADSDNPEPNKVHSYKLLELDRNSGSCTIELQRPNGANQRLISRFEWLKRRRSA